METESGRQDTRREQIGARLAAIQTRIEELKQAQQGSGSPEACSEHLVVAQHHAALSQTAAERALDASIDAFRRAADAHERVAIQHEQAAALGEGRQDEHQRQATFHREAATADRQRAQSAMALLHRVPEGSGGQPPAH